MGRTTHPAWIIDDVLDLTTLGEARRVGRESSRFQPIDKGNGRVLHCALVPPFIDRQLQAAMERSLARKLRNIISFYRLNTSRLDTEFRVHCDTVIQGELPDYAGVFYLETCQDSGTALYEHPVHGRGDDQGLSIFDEDDGKWSPYFMCPEYENRMFLYKSSLFHGRYPWKARGNTRKDGRIVIVKFMKVV